MITIKNASQIAKMREAGALLHEVLEQLKGKIEPGITTKELDRYARKCAEVLGVVSIFTYGMKKGVERMAEAKVKSVSLTNLDTIARVGAEEHYITEADVARLLAFRENPSDESWIQAESQA